MVRYDLVLILCVVVVGFWACLSTDAAAPSCPGSPSFVHAKCSMTVEFANPCSEVRTEMLARMSQQFTGWEDPHNGGHYSVSKVSDAMDVVEGQRVTGTMQYTDKIKFSLTESKPGHCTLGACSESQVFSILDFSTNFCNLYNLYCSESEGCVRVEHSLVRVGAEDLAGCWQHDVTQCGVTPPKQVEGNAETDPELSTKPGARETLESTETIEVIDEEDVLLPEAVMGVEDEESLVKKKKKNQCKKVETQKNFNLTSYIDGKWFIQQEMATKYLPVEWNYCVQAEYTLIPKGGSIWGYTIQVHNYAEEKDGTVHSTGATLCARGDSKSGDPAKLLVAPCFLPSALAGPYWVLAYDASEGYALVSGGQPRTVTHAGLCRTERGTNNAGLWIFTRQQQRDEGLVEKVRSIALEKGFDLSVLNDVDQKGCPVEKIKE